MKKLVLSLVPFLIAGTAFAAGTTKHPAKVKSTATAKTAVSAEIVSADAASKQVTYKTADGQEKTVPVEGKAAASLSAVKAGEKVKLTFRDSASGDHEAITSIRPSGYGKSKTSKPAATTAH